MNNIQEAKELRKKQIFLINLEKQGFKKYKGDLIVFLKAIIINSAKALKAKIKAEGCGEIRGSSWCGYEIKGFKKITRIRLCPNCQEALKILEGVLK